MIIIYCFWVFLWSFLICTHVNFTNDANSRDSNEPIDILSPDAGQGKIMVTNHFNFQKANRCGCLIFAIFFTDIKYGNANNYNADEDDEDESENEAASEENDVEENDGDRDED